MDSNPTSRIFKIARNPVENCEGAQVRDAAPRLSATLRRRLEGRALWRLVAFVVLLAGSLHTPTATALARREPVWDSAGSSAALDRQNRRGPTVAYRQMPPGAPPAVLQQALESDGPPLSANPLLSSEGALNGNFQLVIPVANFPGRGLDLTLTLRYSSRVWAKVGNDFIFDPDADWPAPGWSLGFGKLTGDLLIDADGSRHNLTRTDALHASTIDGTRIDLAWPANPAIPRTVIASYPDGHTVEFAEFSNRGTSYPVRIVDRNGNFITLAYRGPNSAELSTITDTLGRTVTFEYDASDRLTGVVGPGVNGAPHSYLLLYYRHITSVIPLPNGRTDRFDDDFVQAILLPAAGGYNGYWFGNQNSYHQLGMIREVVRQTGMRPLGGGGVAQGTTVRTSTYDFAPSVPAGDIPRYAAMTETWLGGAAPAITRYDIRLTGQIRELETAYPDGSRALQVANETPGIPGSGLVYLSTVADAANNILSRQITEWESGVGGVPRVGSVERGNGQSADVVRVEYVYGPNNEVTEVRELDYDRTVLRRVTTEYVANPAYQQRHIFSLPSVVSVFEGTAATPVSRTDYFYDERRLQPTPGVIQQLVAFSTPFSVFRRGNLTRIVRYADAASRTGPLEEKLNYDTTGNVVEDLRGNSKTTFTRTATSQYAFSESVSTGSLIPNAPVLLTERFEYDVPLGKVKARTNADNVRTDFTYDPATLELERVATIRASTRFMRQDGGLTRIQETRDAAGGVLDRVTVRLDGRGRVVRTERLVDGGATDVQESQFDPVGRLVQMSLPFRAGSIDVHWLSYEYDALNRPTRFSMEDGSASSIVYDEPQRPPAASASRGSTTRRVDRWGRERWYRRDALGRLVEVVEPNPDGGGQVSEAGGLTTLYTYDVLGDLLRIVQGPQVREFGYDALGRLRRQRLPERAATLDADGRYVAIPRRKVKLWSDVFAYDNLGRMASSTDARGVRTVFDYGADPLDRLQRISYDTKSFSDATNKVMPAASVGFEYVASGDVRRLDRVTTAGVGAERYTYTLEGRLASSTTELPAFPATPLVVGYDYDDAGRLKLTRYPAQWNAPSMTRREVTYTYGLAGRLTAMDIGSSWKVTMPAYAPGGLPTGWQWTTETIAAVAGGAGGGALLPETFGLRDSLTFDPRNLQELTHDVAPMRIADQTPLLELSSGYDRHVGRADTGTITLAVLDPAPAATAAIGEQLTSEGDATSGAGDREFWYDTLGRLARAASGVTAQPGLFGNTVQTYRSAQEYRYDRFGNRVGVRAVGPPLPTACTTQPCVPAVPEIPADQRDGWSTLAVDPATNRIVTAGFAYDAAGNLVSAPQLSGDTHTYQYDAAGRLVSARDGAGRLLERYAYAYGRRRFAALDAAGAGTVYAWSGGYVIAEYDMATGTDLRWRRSLIRSGTRVLGSFSLEQGREVVDIRSNDRVGERLVTRAEPQGSILTTTRMDALPFGRRTPGGNMAGARFANYVRSDATGLDYATNRFYAPELGRFLETDPLASVALDLKNPQTLNLYAYVSNDPVNRSDFFGLKDDEKECPDDEIYIEGQGCTPVVLVVGKHPTGPSAPPVNAVIYPTGSSQNSGRGPLGGENVFDELNLGRGVQIGGGISFCLVLCMAVDLHFGVYQAPITEEFTWFGTLGSGTLGPGPPANQSYDPPRPTGLMPGLGLGLSAGFDTQAFITQASTYSDFSGWSYGVNVSAPGGAIGYSQNALGQRAFYFGPAGGIGGGISAYPSMTLPQR